MPEVVIDVLNDDPPPQAVQAVTNLLDSAGAMKRYEGPAQPRDIIAAASSRGVGVMGVRAVQAGALTWGFDRDLPTDHPDMEDYRRAEPFREIAREMGESPAALAHRYVLAIPGVSTVVLGVKNREELWECLEAEARGPLDAETTGRLARAVGHS